MVVAGKRIPVPGLSLSGTCPTLGVGAWASAPSDQPPPAARFGSLSATIEAPASVRAGGTLEYVVTLTNIGPTPLSLFPCPGYTEEFYKNRQSYQLNCVSVGVIRSGGSVRFAMRIAVLAYTPTGPTTLTWGLVDGEGESAEASTTVTVS